MPNRLAARLARHGRVVHGGRSRIFCVKHQKLDTGLREVSQVSGGRLSLGRAERLLNCAHRVKAQHGCQMVRCFALWSSDGAGTNLIAPQARNFPGERNVGREVVPVEGCRIGRIPVQN